jgi:hypothetical protein
MHRGRKTPMHSSSSTKLFLQNVISGNFPSSSHGVNRLEIANMYTVGVFYVVSDQIQTLQNCLITQDKNLVWVGASDK